MRRAFVFLLVSSLLISLPQARPFQSPTLDGTITGDGIDWDASDLAVDDPLGDTTWGPNDIDDLWITYDAENLYIGIRYRVENNAMLVLIDAGTGVGASDIANLDWYPRNFNFPDSLLAEFIIANWNGGGLGVRRITGNATTEDITSGCGIGHASKGLSFYESEIRIPWNSIYRLGPGLVQPGARVKVVTMIAGGDRWNGPDSAPHNPGMDGAGSPTTIFNMFGITVDYDGDGAPDGFEGAIEGTVAYEDLLDEGTVATVTAFSEASGNLITQTATPPGGGPYRLAKLPDGSYRVEASASGYSKGIASNIIVSGQGTVSGVDFVLEPAGKITGHVVFADGPGSTVSVTAYNRQTGEVPAEGFDDLPETGGFFTLLVPEGSYRVIAEAEGYVPDAAVVDMVGSDSIYIDTLSLYAVRATKLVLIDDEGNEQQSINTTVSFPDSNIFFYARALIEARDGDNRRDYYNLDAHLDRVNLRATKLNNYSDPRGNVTFYTTDTIPATSISITEGRGSFLASSDEIEVLRVFTETATGSISGRFKLGIRSAEPEFIQLSALDREITADGEDEVVIEAKLLDISMNPVRVSGVPVSFSLSPSSSGAGSFTIPSTVTSADGEAVTTLKATGSGSLRVTAAATYLNRDLTVIGDGENDYIEITAVAGEPAAIRITSESDVLGFNEEMAIEAQLVDVNGNPVHRAGYTLTFSYSPVSAGILSPAVVALDDEGYAAVTFTAAAERAVVQVDATSTPGLPIKGITFLIDRIVTVSDPRAPEPDQAHNSLPQMDLTTVSIGNGPDGINVTVKFATNFNGTHIGMILETENNVAGASSDPFGFPISYGHNNLPEFVLTYKYTADDYADLRKWGGAGWLWWDSAGERYVTDWVEGANIRSAWVEKDTASVSYQIPFDIFEGDVPQSLRLQVYVMQEEGDTKRSAFDSAPHDSTLDIDFDPFDPEAPWEITKTPVTLHHYSDPYEVNLDFPTPPVLSSPTANPPTVEAGGTVTFSVAVTDAGDGIGAVLINLSPIGGPRFQTMRDDGTNGDQTAGDGTYSHRYILDPDIAGGDYDIVITAKDRENISRSETAVTVSVEGIVTPIRSFTDATQDDHGPNQFGKEGLYYYYPTNSVFVPRSFDLEEVVIFETSKIVGGVIIPSLAFQVRIGDVPDPADEGTADWNPLYADINTQKVDVYIDAFKGGATEGLPNRQNDFVKWDAWDYAIVMEGWYKGVITSNNQNTPQAWATTVRKTDRDIILLSDFEQNTLTAVASKEALGNPTTEDILNWDITVLLTSHDGNSTDNNFGDTRWVNASTSEWQFGGGADTDRDPNVIDFAASPGVGRKPGRGQSELLDYKSPEAVARSEAGETAVVLEATAFEDQGPPVITLPALIEETIHVIALENAPIYFTAAISDDDDVMSATFFWRPDSSTSGVWTGELPMGYAGGERWSVDLPIDEITSLVPIAEYDSTRNIEFTIEAHDPSGNVATTPLYTMEIPLPVKSYEVTGLDLTSDTELLAPEGTSIRIPGTAIPAYIRELPFTFRLSPRYLSDFALPPQPAASINVIRTIELEGVVEGAEPVDDVIYPVVGLEDVIEISFHYPQYAVGSIDENLLGVYEYFDRTDTWVYIGGTVNPFGNLITISAARTGTYGVFFNSSITYAPGEVFSGVVFSPNPFSPNGDGLYEETQISFFLTTEATVTVEIFDMDGNRVRILERRFPFTAEDDPEKQPRRVTGLVWDGRDNTGRIVPYGIYITRFTVTFSQAAGTRTIRINKAVAVIK